MSKAEAPAPVSPNAPYTCGNGKKQQHYSERIAYPPGSRQPNGPCARLPR